MFTANKQQQLSRVFMDEPFACLLPADVLITHPATVHHCKNVLRLKPLAPIIVVDPFNQVSYLAAVQHLNKKEMTVSVTEVYQSGNTSQFPKIIAGVALIKSQRWDWMLQKLTELGVCTISPLQTQRLSKEASYNNKQDRWQQIVRSAAEQSEGLFLPDVQPPSSLTQFAEQAQQASVKLLLAERGDNRQAMASVLQKALTQKATISSVALAIGPEAGWTEEEVQFLISQGFTAVCLGNRILRSETAAIAAVSALVYQLTA